MRVFLDANILFSAVKSNGAIRELLTRTRTAGHTPVADEYVVAEARRNLELKAADASPGLARLLRTVEVSAHHARPLPASLAPELPDKDRPVLAAAIHLRCDALVTGDRTHFGALYGHETEGVTVYSPRQFAELELPEAKKP